MPAFVPGYLEDGIDQPASTMQIDQRTIELEKFPDSSFRPPELGQPFWSPLPLAVKSQVSKCLDPNAKLLLRLSRLRRKSLRRTFLPVFSLMKRYEFALIRSMNLAIETATMPMRTGARPRLN